MKEGMGKPGGLKGRESSEQLARMAAQQEMIRNQMQKLMNEMMKEGNGNSGNLRNIANKMEQTETDLVNRNISAETIQRQQEILTRLLEAEKAEREKGLDDQRESNENKNELTRNKFSLNQYNDLMRKETELLRTIPPALKPFYKNMVKEYFNTIQ
jgi:chromosome segregation ATPase